MDGHNPHYTKGFLDYARTHAILVLCYPAHATHIYQGLDVVVFSVLKTALSEERDIFEHRTHEKISKENFLTVYGLAHLRALTPEMIKAAFRKTGVWPFDPSVVTPSMMAPSKETLCEGQLPVPPATPVRAVAKLLEKLSVRDKDRLEADIPVQQPLSSSSTSSAPHSMTDIHPKVLSHTTAFGNLDIIPGLLVTH